MLAADLGGEALDLLRRGAIEVEGRLVDASNTTLRGQITLDGVSARCVYKPVAGERPLWDFPDGTLAGREVSAYLVSEATGWELVPPTVLRDGPLGVGACQLWIEEPAQAQPVVGFLPGRKAPPGWFPITAARGEDGKRYVLAHANAPGLARMAVFDAVINNGDRKGGHVLTGDGGHLFGVDHGVTFHTEDKLRTILWGWVNDPLPQEAVEVLRALRGVLDGVLGEALAEHLTLGEVAATRQRVDRLLAAGRFPLPSEDWPAVPWPPV
ncbi:SCO1664 family protein [Rhizomonospora bruguierae]|uniref:SCO1664 family protein n=1 Tax=Rhizomonospora bruguierae TaxID=1581705 RepID=UPI001BD1BB3E|nr:SCO1664 family protein [Micromonospora sp. NBRC 107566]